MCVHTGGKEIRERLEEGEKKEIQEKYLGLIENACMHLEFDSGNANKNKNRYLRRNRIIQRKPTTVKYSNQYSYTSQSKQGPKKRYEFINSPNHFYPFSLTPPPTASTWFEALEHCLRSFSAPRRLRAYACVPNGRCGTSKPGPTNRCGRLCPAT